MGNAERRVGLEFRQGFVAGLLKRGVTEEEIGLDAFRDGMAATLGDELRPWHFTYTVRVGVV